MKDDDATTEGTTDGAASADPAAILETVATAVADCKSQTRLLEARKAALLVELGTVSDALEDVYNSRKQLEEMADDLLEDLSEVLSSDAHIEARQKFEAAVAMAQRPPDAQTIGQAKGAARPDQQKAHRQRVRKADKTQSKQAQHDARKAERLAALMPETAEAREALKRRQIVVRGLPPALSTKLDWRECSAPCMARCLPWSSLQRSSPRAQTSATPMVWARRAKRLAFSCTLVAPMPLLPCVMCLLPQLRPCYRLSSSMAPP